MERKNDVSTLAAAPAPGALTRHPVSFAGCFGWLHTLCGAACGDVGVVLCAGIKTDAMTGHRPFRQLADALAAAGFPTLRFDYPGTGDSEEPAEDADGLAHWEVWQHSVHAACDWLRRQCGVRRIVLGGLRLGALLAATVAAERAELAALLLLAPVLRGRSFIRQLSIEAKLLDPAAQEAGALVLHELRLSADQVERISQAALRGIVLPPACQVAIFAEAPSPVLDDICQAWRAAGAPVTLEDFAGLAPMLRPVFLNHEAAADVSRVAAWLRDALPPAPGQAHRPPPPAELRPPGCVDTPLRFGPDAGLFGMWCRPRHQASRDLVVVIGNSSGNPHAGFARVATDLARRLAQAGIASLRMDFAGLGDSVAPGDAATHIFETDRSGDVSAAIDALAELGYRRFALQGLCSGAYHAFHAAVADARVSDLLLVNIPLFEWQHGTPVEQLRFGAEPPPAPPSTDVAQRGMAVLHGRTRTLLLCGEGDVSQATLAATFGPAMVPQGATLRVVPGLDHTLTGRQMQAAAAREMIGFLQQA